MVYTVFQIRFWYMEHDKNIVDDAVLNKKQNEVLLDIIHDSLWPEITNIDFVLQEEEPSVDNMDVDYEFFNNKLWPRLAHRIPAFENIKASFNESYRCIIQSSYRKISVVRPKLYMHVHKFYLRNKSNFGKYHAI